MSFLAFVFILVSVFLHAGWNFLSKKTLPSIAFYALMSGTSALFDLIFLICAGLDWAALPLRFWLAFAGSLFCNFIYLTSLSVAYKKGDISMVYPLIRAIPVILTAAITMTFGIGKMPTVCAMIGMVVVSVGCFIVPLNKLSYFRWQKYINRTMLFVLIGALGICGYTITDSLASACMREYFTAAPWLLALCYMFCIDFGNFCTLGLATLARKDERENFGKLFGKTWTPSFAGICSTVAYVLVLLSMQHVTNVCYVQAFRQMSLPVGVLLGVIILKEKVGPVKLAGLILVVAGLALTAF